MNCGLRYTVAMNSVPYRFYPSFYCKVQMFDNITITRKTSIIIQKFRSVFAVFFAVFFAIRNVLS